MFRHFGTLTQLNILGGSTLPCSIEQPTSTQGITIQQILFFLSLNWEVPANPPRSAIPFSVGRIKLLGRHPELFLLTFLGFLWSGSKQDTNVHFPPLITLPTY